MGGARRREGEERRELGVIWEIPDELWERIRPILEAYWPRKKRGRPPADWRGVLNGIIFRLRTGCQWNRLPKEFGDDSTVHRWFQRWCRDGVMERIWSVLVAECDELKGVYWEWQAADGAMAKARFGGKKNRSESNRPRQKWDQAKRVGRRARGPVGSGCGRRERA